MIPDQEENIFATLFERAARVRWTMPGDAQPDTRQFVTTTRRIKLFNEVDSSYQPWCGQTEHASTAAQVSNMPYKWTLEAQWIIYQSDAKDPTAVPTITNNKILGGVGRALEPLPNDPGFRDRRNTLNGLVYHCFIQGRIIKDPGDIDGQGLIVVPIKLLVP